MMVGCNSVLVAVERSKHNQGTTGSRILGLGDWKVITIKEQDLCQNSRFLIWTVVSFIKMMSTENKGESCGETH